jgi:hypothetical protein
LSEKRALRELGQYAAAPPWARGAAGPLPGIRLFAQPLSYGAPWSAPGQPAVMQPMAAPPPSQVWSYPPPVQTPAPASLPQPSPPSVGPVSDGLAVPSAPAAVAPPPTAPSASVSLPSAAPTGVLDQITAWLGTGNNKYYALAGAAALVVFLMWGGKGKKR